MSALSNRLPSAYLPLRDLTESRNSLGTLKQANPHQGLRRLAASSAPMTQLDKPISIAEHALHHPWQRLQARGAIAQAAIRLGQAVRGALTRSDAYKPQLRSYIDEYSLKGIKPGQIFEVNLNSRALDAELRLVDARTQKVLLYGEDTSSYNPSPRLIFAATGAKYLVRISSAQNSSRYSLKTSSKTGNYRLHLQPIATHSSFDFFSGAGLVNAAAAVSQAARRDLFVEAGDRLNPSVAWAQGYTGRGVTIAVLDSGVDYTHPDLQQNIWQNPGEIANNGIDDDGNGFIDDIRGWNFAENSSEPIDLPYDGHGTHVAGIIAAANNKVGTTGVAYDAKIMPVKVIDGENTSDVLVAKGIRYAVQNGAAVINISLGKAPTTQLSQDMIDALQIARQAGAIVVIAAGNRRQTLGATQPDNPAAYAAAQGLGIAVGAVDRSGRLFIDSNPAGSIPLAFVVAPGVSIRSTVPGGNYASFSGTSMATPYVSGLMALMLSANPTLTPAKAAEILALTSNRQSVVTAL